VRPGQSSHPSRMWIGVASTRPKSMGSEANRVTLTRRRLFKHLRGRKGRNLFKDSEKRLKRKKTDAICSPTQLFFFGRIRAFAAVCRVRPVAFLEFIYGFVRQRAGASSFLVAADNTASTVPSACPERDRSAAPVHLRQPCEYLLSSTP
jgi:hypothetical protein